MVSDAPLLGALSYELVSGEYYDSVRHPTSANFRKGSVSWVSRWLARRLKPSSTVLEVGCGASVVAKLIIGATFKSLTLLDASPSMLQYSRHWASSRVGLTLGSASNLPICDSSVDILVSIAGDPYNEVRFWSEVSRVLHQDGIALFTTPSFEWSSAFRRGSHVHPDFAEFELGSGASVLVPSLVLPMDRQIQLLEQAGLKVIETANIKTSTLGKEASPKLLRATNEYVENVVTTYAAVKGRMP